MKINDLAALMRDMNPNSPEVERTAAQLERLARRQTQRRMRAEVWRGLVPAFAAAVAEIEDEGGAL